MWSAAQRHEIIGNVVDAATSGIQLDGVGNVLIAENLICDCAATSSTAEVVCLFHDLENWRKIAWHTCNTSSLQRALPRRGLQHAAFDVASSAELTEVIVRLGDLGARRVGGPGRHGPGNMLSPTSKTRRKTCWNGSRKSHRSMRRHTRPKRGIREAH
jgi:hypothetical protein